MQTAILTCLLSAVVLVSCRPAGPAGPAGPEIKIISQTYELNADGSYQYAYETENGIKGNEAGTIKKSSNPTPAPGEENVIAVVGSVSYTSPEGQVINLGYTADDETGFVPTGDHLPTPPPIPDAIAKALAYIASQPSTPEPPARG